jgi:hypothetical protein
MVNIPEDANYDTHTHTQQDILGATGAREGSSGEYRNLLPVLQFNHQIIL